MASSHHLDAAGAVAGRAQSTGGTGREDRPYSDRMPTVIAREPLRVLHCLWSGETGGAERAVYQLVREQLRAGSVAPSVLFAKRGGPYWDRIVQLGCPTVTLDLPHGYAVHRIGAIAEAMGPYDIAHFHSAEPMLILASLRNAALRRVYTHRGGIIRYSPRKRLQYAATGALLKRRFHGLSGNTAHAARCAGELFQMDASRFRVTYNGIDFGLLESVRDPVEVRAELGLWAQDFVLGTSANLRPWKRIDRLLRSLATLGRPELRLLIVGDGLDRPRLEALADSLGVAARTVFAGRQSNVGDYLQVMDAFCLPSMGLESFGNAAVEAMGLGVPTIVFADGGGTVEHIDDGRTGFVVADEPALEAILAGLLDDRENLGHAVGERGREAVRSKYTPVDAARRYEDLYTSAARRAGADRLSSEENPQRET